MRFSVAFPEPSTAAWPSVVVPSLPLVKVTLPVGTAAPVAPAKLATMETVWPVKEDTGVTVNEITGRGRLLTFTALPCSPAVRGALKPEPSMVRVPVRTPVAAGVKLIAMEQLAPTASVVPQLLVSANSAVVEIPLNVTDDVPVFVTTTDPVLPVPPVAWVPKVSRAVEIESGLGVAVA